MPKEKVQNSNPEKETKSHNIPDIDRDYIKKIAATAKEMRIKAGYSYESFAIFAGINRNSYFRFERSATTGDNYTIALLLKITRGLNITMSNFFQDIK
jgi:transcriptional regulator with XRE-family HTH domain